MAADSGIRPGVLELPLLLISILCRISSKSTALWVLSFISKRARSHHRLVWYLVLAKKKNGRLISYRVILFARTKEYVSVSHFWKNGDSRRFLKRFDLYQGSKHRCLRLTYARFIKMSTLRLTLTNPLPLPKIEMYR